MLKKNIGKIKVSLATVIIVICSVATAVAVYWIQTEPIEGAASVVAANNFSATGNLTKNNPGMEKNVWYLIYEKPGQAAISTKLLFSVDSICKLLTTEEICKTSKLTSGKRVRVIGNFVGRAVQVQRLTAVK
ncbi:MAG: hypothetical protein A2174_01695 [Candidatus Portnoybacteria bacterium RBG_13_41_18]|uniref:Uncharacterized protein n=1 Tax=Candidatus Portnoybacteria bacterium RBG_13_41_18 TaxID=1801991 RepID=A0A1G2FAR5_9BACT|nr:MAG: hypothetical protein A2174_01695 [Candidatus Portnoybacteria bacterium RBG_13_41_18]